MIPAETASVPSDQAGPFPDQLRLAVAAYVARFKGTSREHTASDLRCSLSWCAGHTLDPLAVQRADLEKYVRWMQVLLNSRGSRMDRHAATRRLRRLAATAHIQAGRAHPQMLRHTSPPCSTQASTSGTFRLPPGTPTRAPRCESTR
jgi:hypothetical protein